MSNNAQDIYIQGGGTLTDWAHLKKYEQSNSELKKINEPDRIVFMGPWSPGMDPGPKVVKLNSILKNYCDSNNIPYVDYFSAMSDEKGGLKVPEYTTADDLVHPNLAGYKVMEKIILKALN